MPPGASICTMPSRAWLWVQFSLCAGLSCILSVQLLGSFASGRRRFPLIPQDIVPCVALY